MAPRRHSIEAAFGRALREVRSRQKLSQEQLALKCGVHPTYVSQLERGLKSPSLRTIERLAVALGMRPHLLVKAAEDSF